MRLLRVCGLFMLGLMLWAQQPESKALVVDQVIEMVKAGLSDDVIILKLQRGKQVFNLGTEDLIRLRAANVSDSVVKFMLDPEFMAAGSNVVGNSNDPMLPHDSGIYLYTHGSNGEAQMIFLERAAYAGVKTSGMLGALVSQGFKKVKLKAVVGGVKSSVRVPDHSLVFYFYFDGKQAGLGESYWGLGRLSNPKQFALLRLDVKGTGRETTIAAAGATGASSGEDPKAMVPFESERIRPGLYKVTVDEIADGEYCFFSSSPMLRSGVGGYGQGAPPLREGMDIFDFGVGGK